MMGANIIKLCILVGLLQGRSCATISDINGQFLPTLQELEKDISAILSFGPALVSNIEGNLTSIISSANGTIGNVVNGLETAVSNTINQTQHLGEDIASCVQNLTSALSNLNLSSVLAPCVPNLNISGILNEILDLGAKIPTLVSAGISCVTDNMFRPVKLQKCLDEVIAEARGNVSLVLGHLEAIRNLPGQIQSCVRDSCRRRYFKGVEYTEGLWGVRPGDCAKGHYNTKSVIA